jgi:hypothetical protein
MLTLKKVEIEKRSSLKNMYLKFKNRRCQERGSVWSGGWPVVRWSALKSVRSTDPLTPLLLHPPASSRG